MSKRLSLIMTDADEEAIRPYVTVGTPEHDALQQWAVAAGARVSGTEASALRVLLRAGTEQLRGAALDSAYADLADELNGDRQTAADRRAHRARYAERTDAQLA